MRTGRVPLAALLLVLASPVLQVSSSNDIYWEGEEYASNEFLEVKHDDPTVLDSLKRFKRQWNPFSFFSPSKEEEAETVTDAIPDDSGSYGKDDADMDVGSGVPDKSDSEPREKTLRVTFLVMEPYITAYSNRDSPEFLNISHSLANAVDLLFESLPGTQRSSLVRIQSLVNDDFLCKVTLDIVTTRNEDTDTIKDILRNHIKNNGRLGETSVRDGDFSAQVIDPGTTFDCDFNEFSCGENICLPMSAKCNGLAECRDGRDEYDCPEPDTSEAPPPTEGSPVDYDNNIDDNDNQPTDNQNPDDRTSYEATPDYRNTYDATPETPNNYDQTVDNIYNQTLENPDNRYDTNAGPENRNNYDQNAGVDNRNSYDENAGPDNRDPYTNTGTENRNSYDQNAGVDNRNSYDENAGPDNRDPYTNTGTENRNSYDQNAGVDNRNSYDENAGPDNRDPYTNTGTENRNSYDQNAGVDNRNSYDQNAGPDNRDLYGTNVGPDNRDPYGTNAGPDNRNAYGPSAGPDNRSPDSRSENPDNRNPVDSASETPSSGYDQESGYWPRGDLGGANDPSSTDTPDDTDTETETDIYDATTSRINYECPSTHTRCDETRCVESTRRCDGILDCNDGTDEAGCPSHKLKLFKEEPRAEYHMMLQEFQKLLKEVSQLKVSLNSSNERVDSLEARVNALELKLEQKAPSIEDPLVENNIAELKFQLNKRDQKTLKDIKVTGIPEDKVITIKLVVTADEKDVVHDERVGSTRNTVETSDGSISLSVSADLAAQRSRSISVGFARRTSRDALLRTERVRGLQN